MEPGPLNAVESATAISRAHRQPLYVVGGTVRDVLIGRVSRDIDLLFFGDAWEMAAELAREIGGSWFVLDEAHRQVRVVSRGGHGFHLDISESRGATLLENLGQRDFTVNAMALSIEDYQGFLIDQDLNRLKERVVDPVGGLPDIRERTLRVSHRLAFEDDPLRMLRALRLAGKIGLVIEPVTRQMIIDSSGLLRQSAPERVRDEIFQILSLPQSAGLIVESHSLGLLRAVLPEMAATVGVTQNQHHALDVWGHSLAALKSLESRPWLGLDLGDEIQGRLDGYLNHPLSEGRPRWLLLKMTALLHDVGKPKVRQEGPEGKVTFYRHESVGAGMVSSIADRLRLSRREERFLSTVVYHHLRPLHLFLAKNHTMKAEYRFFKQLGNETAAVLLLSLADRSAGKPEREAAETIEYFKFCEQLLKNYHQEYLNATHDRLIGGEELVSRFGLSPGPLVGRILDQVEEAQMESRISTRDDAYGLVRNILDQEKLDRI
ncbi:MAG: HD domain-containing protein [Firmicutes bacterium]|nr:HD domain-containing protein [Bacillota bacterium]